MTDCRDETLYVLLHVKVSSSFMTQTWSQDRCGIDQRGSVRVAESVSVVVGGERLI